MGKPVIADGQALITWQMPCVQATFYQPEDNPYFAISATDGRGTLYGLDYESVRPHLIEIICSERNAIRGNHVHQHCTEMFTVMSGEISMFLLCMCPGKHLLEKVMVAGMTVRIAAGTPHAVFARTKGESVAAYSDGDPRHDRDRVILLEY